MRRLVALAFVSICGVLGAETPEPAAPLASGVLHDNGPFVNSPGTGAGGADESVLQSSLGLELFGFRNPVGEYALADNFIVPEPNGWWIDSATVFGYEVGSTLESTFTTVIVRIWNGLPGAPGSLIVFGANPPHDLRYTTWTGAYRVIDTLPGDTDRPIMAHTVRIGHFLTPGTYWLEWSAIGTPDAVVFSPPITLTGQADTGNGRQLVVAVPSWSAAEDNGHPQGFPFVLRGRQATCRAPEVPIPDGDPAGVTDGLEFGAGADLIDINVHVAVTHPVIANLVVRLEHEDSATIATVLDRPTCTESDIEATLDDEAAEPAAEQCENSLAAIYGHFSPENPLSPFDGESSVGTWNLTVADEANNFVGTLNAWCLDITLPTFDDVPAGAFGAAYVEALYGAEVTGGCGTTPPVYCPGDFVTRAQMAVFLLKGSRGPHFVPGTATGTVFDDVDAADFAAAWIERLAAEGITGGCSAAPPLYCPGNNVTRAQMAVFLLRAKHGPLYNPPAATGLVFEDVGPGDFAADWIEALAAEGITGGCQAAPPLYCPGANVTRAQMAVFLVRAFDLPLP